jgi:uncharacterized UPF0160 family protein
VLDNCDVIIDVGGVYEPDNNRFDHHQRGFGEVFGHGYNTKLSSAGALDTHSSSLQIYLARQQPADVVSTAVACSSLHSTSLQMWCLAQQQGAECV